MAESCEASGKQMGNCEVCDEAVAIYTCPKCEYKTCSLNCVLIHKKELDCSGERNVTKYIPLTKFNNLIFLSDYRFLENASRILDNCKNNPLKKFTQKNKLSSNLRILRSAALRRQTTVHFLPQHFTRHRNNSTHVDLKTRVIFWKLDLVFPQGEYIKIALENCNENDRLALVLSQLIEFEKCPDLYKHYLKFYHACGFSGIEVLLKAENIKPSDSFFLLDLTLTLKENFENVTLIENPILHVILKEHKDEYTIVDPDEEIHFSLRTLNFEENRRSNKFHYFDAVTYTNERIISESTRSNKICHSALKKYFATESDESDFEANHKEKKNNEKRPIWNEGESENEFVLNVPEYDELVK